MAANLAAALTQAQRAAAACTLGVEGDPLRLELPPEGVGRDELDPKAAAVLGALYLISELDQLGVLGAAELLAAERWNLGVRDHAAVAALEKYASAMRDHPDAAMRAALFSRLFGAPSSGVSRGSAGLIPGSRNDVFEELLAGYCQAITGVRDGWNRRATIGLRQTGDRLRGNLAPRQFGNTMIVSGTLIDQLRSALDLLALADIGRLFGTTGPWGVLRALHAGETADIGRRVDRGQSGRTVLISAGFPPVPDLVDSALADAAETWLVATGFSAAATGG